MNISERKSLVNQDDTLSIRHQCELASVCRSSVYYTPSVESDENLAIMRRLDELYCEHPSMGLKKLLATLMLLGIKINHKRLRRLMRLVRWQTIYPQRRTTVIDGKSYKYPYLLNNIKIEKANQVWAIDITYIPMRQGFMYLFAIIDVYSRYIVGWSLSNTMTAEWCCETLNEAFERYGTPEIINSDQGSQFTSEMYVDLLKDNGIQISMDGKGRALDNIYIERFWRTIKYDEIYPRPCQSGDELWRNVSKYMEWYNCQRPHQSIGNVPPVRLYAEGQAA
jgi:putative transposase